MEIINPFKDQNIEIVDLPVAEDSRFGSSLLNSAKELQIGNGSNVFRGDKSGIWLGAKTFALAPFSVAMDGSVIATGLTISGYIPTGGAAGDINANSTTISGGKITTGSISTDKLVAGELVGFTMKTGITGRRTELTSTFIGFYDESNNNVATLYAGTNSFKIQYANSSTNILLDCGTSGAISFMSGGSQKFLYSDSQNGLYPYSNSSIDLGVYARSWKDLWLNSVGSVGASGTQGASFPSGWSVSRIATGRYQITHNYNSYDYVVNVTVVSSVAKVWAVEVKSNNSFNVRIANTSFTLEDNDFDFIVIRN